MRKTQNFYQPITCLITAPSCQVQPEKANGLTKTTLLWRHIKSTENINKWCIKIRNSINLRTPKREFYKNRNRSLLLLLEQLKRETNPQNTCKSQALDTIKMQTNLYKTSWLRTPQKIWSRLTLFNALGRRSSDLLIHVTPKRQDLELISN